MRSLTRSVLRDTTHHLSTRFARFSSGRSPPCPRLCAFAMVELQYVALPDCIETIKLYAAFVASGYLANVVREALEAFDLRRGDLRAAAHDPNEVRTMQCAVEDHTAGDVAEAGDLE